MTLRIMLVGLVASLGFEPPSGPDVARWAQAGVAWVQARMDERSGSKVEIKLDHAGPSDCQQAYEPIELPDLVGELGLRDDVFEVVSNEMVTDLAADLAVERQVASDAAFEAVSKEMVVDLAADLLAGFPEEVPGLEVGPTLVVEESAPVVGSEIEPMGCLIDSADHAERVDVESTVEAPLVESSEGSSARIDRLSSALRLTREAVKAWASLVQPCDEESEPTR